MTSSHERGYNLSLDRLLLGCCGTHVLHPEILVVVLLTTPIDSPCLHARFANWEIFFALSDVPFSGKDDSTCQRVVRMLGGMTTQPAVGVSCNQMAIYNTESMSAYLLPRRLNLILQ